MTYESWPAACLGDEEEDDLRTPTSEQNGDAWIALQYIKGRSQTQIAAQLGVTSSVICKRIVRFCAALGCPVEFSRYGDERIDAACEALRRHLNSLDGEITEPEHNPGEHDPTFAHARMEHAWLLRAEGLTLQQVGKRLGVGRERARQIVDKFSRRVKKATRKTTFKILAGPHETPPPL